VYFTSAELSVLPVVKLHAIVQCERESQTIVRTLDVRRELARVVKLLILLDEAVEDQRAHAFAGRVD
jgi:hypothetical protein